LLKIKEIVVLVHGIEVKIKFLSDKIQIINSSKGILIVMDDDQELAVFKEWDYWICTKKAT